MQQYPLVTGTESKKSRDLSRGQAVNVSQGHDFPLALRQLSQAILELRTAFGGHGFLFRCAWPGPRLAYRRPVPRPLVVWAAEAARIDGRAVVLVVVQRRQRHGACFPYAA